MKSIVKRFGWTLTSILLLLLAGCFKSEHPLLTVAQAVTPLPAKFSAVEINSDGTIKLPGPRNPSKIPQTQTLTLSDGSYLLSSEGEGKPASITFANLDQNRGTFLAQYITKGGVKTESQMYYGVVKRTGNIVSTYLFPDLGFSAAFFGATSNFLGDIFQDLPHLMAAARKFEDDALATSPVIYRIASTPEEVSQLQRDVDAASQQHTVAAVPLIGDNGLSQAQTPDQYVPYVPGGRPVPATPPPVEDNSATSPQDADILATPTCISLQDANAFLSKHGIGVLMRLEGELLFEQGTDVDLDESNTANRFNVALYNFDGKVHWTISESDAPLSKNPTETCPIANGLLYAGNLADLGKYVNAALQNQIAPHPVQEVLNVCEKVWPIIDEHIQGKLQKFGGRTMALADTLVALEHMQYSLNHTESDAEFSAKQREIRQRQEREHEALKEIARSKGDARCNTLEKQIEHAQAAGTQLVAQLSGNDLKLNIPATISILISPTMNRWIMLFTSRSGATVPYGDGFKLEIRSQVYAALFAP